MKRRTRWSVLHAGAVGAAAVFPHLLGAVPSTAQTGAPEEARALSVAMASLEAITRGDMVALTDLMVEEAFVVAVGGADGDTQYRLRTREEERRQVFDVEIVERGFDGEVRLSGRLAQRRSDACRHAL